MKSQGPYYKMNAAGGLEERKDIILTAIVDSNDGTGIKDIRRKHSLDYARIDS